MRVLWAATIQGAKLPCSCSCREVEQQACDKTADVSKDTGKAVGHGTTGAAKTTGKAVDKGAKATGNAVRTGADKTADAVK
jgi:hypothetical protein